METFTEDMFEFRGTRIVGGDKGARVGGNGWVEVTDGMALERWAWEICLVMRDWMGFVV